MKQGGTASCPEILGEGKPASESPTLDFGALALEIVSSLEGKESDGVAPVISTDSKKNPDVGSDFKGPTECRWDDECASEQNQVDNKTLLLCVNKRCAYVRGRCVADQDCKNAGGNCFQNYCEVDKTKIEQRCTRCSVGQTCKMEGGKPVCVRSP